MFLTNGIWYEIFKILNAKKIESGKHLFGNHIICLLLFVMIFWKKTMIYLLKVNNRNIRTRCEICSKLTKKTPEQRQERRSGVFIVRLTLNIFHTLF